MAKKKYYAVKKGKSPGVYGTWNACKAQVDGFSGALYKSFTTQEEAAAYVGDVCCPDETEMELPGEGEAVAYVDGSYNAATGEYSCGVVLCMAEKNCVSLKRGKIQSLHR